MTSWQMVRVLAGSLILISLLFGADASPLFLSRHWLWLNLFVGANLLQSGFSCWCLSERIFRNLGVREGA